MTMTHKEVAEAIEAGKQLQRHIYLEGEVDGWRTICHMEAEITPPCDIRIKPEPVARLEYWGPDDGSRIYRDMQAGPSAICSIHFREVRPGDLTREEVESLLRICDESEWLTPAAVRSIFLGES